MMRIALFAGLVLWASFAIGCREKAAKPTRDECTKVAEHIAELIIADFVANPEQWWDAVQGEAGDSGIPVTIDRSGFKPWLDTPAGKTWLMQRRGNTLSGVQHGIDPCVENASKALVKCLLATKTKADVVACDDKHGKRGATQPLKPDDGSANGNAGSAESK